MGQLHDPRNNLHPVARGLLPIIVLSAFLFPPFGLVLFSRDYLYIAVLLPLVFFGIVTVEKLSRGDLVVTRTNILMPLFLLILLTGYSLSYAENPMQGVRELAKIVLSVGLFLCFVEVCRSPKHLKRLLKAIVWAGIGFSLHGILFVFAIGVLGLQASDQVGIIDEYASGFDFRIHTYDLLGLPGFASRQEDFVAVGPYQLPRCASLFIEPGYFSNFLELSIFSTLAYYYLLRNGRTWPVSIGLFLQCVAMLLTFSVGGWVAISLGALVWFIVSKKFSLVDLTWAVFRKVPLLISVFIAVGLIAPGIMLDVTHQVVIEKVVSDKLLTSGAMRLISIQLGLDSAFRHPLLGVGIGQMSNLESPGFAGDVKYGANNALLSTQIELGFLGLILYGWILLSILSTLVGVAKRAIRTMDTSKIRVAASISGGVVALIFHSMIVETKWVPFYWIGISLLYIQNNLLRRRLNR